MPSLPELSGDINKDLSPLTGSIEKDLGPAPATPLSPPKPAMGSMGIPADIQARVERPFGLPKMPVAPAFLAAPGTGVLSGAAGQGIAGAGEELIKGGGPRRALGKGLESGIAALIAGGMTRGLFQPVFQKAGAAATKEFENAQAARETGIKAVEEAHKFTGKVNKEMTGALNTLEKGAYEAAQAKRATEVAAGLAKDLKKNVPALSPFPDSEAGLADMLYGRGKKIVSRAFDKALKTVAANAKGKMIPLPTEAANALGVQGSGGTMLPLSRVAREALEKAGKLPPVGMTSVDAGELANAAVGAWRKNPAAYRMAMEALDGANLGDPQARAAYKYYTGQLDYFNATKALKGETFNPAAYRAGATSKNIEILRRRGIGSLTEGPMNLTKGGPLAPIPRAVPPQSPLPAPPPEVPKPDIRTVKNPLAGHPFALGGGLEAINYGLTGSHGYGVPFLTGVAAANALPREIVTKTPGVPNYIQRIIQAMTKAGGAAGSLYGP